MTTFKGYDADVMSMIEEPSMHEKSPFVSHELEFIDDLNKNSNYKSSNGMVNFETEISSIDGKWDDHKNDYLMIPLVIVVDGTDGSDDPINFSTIMCNNMLSFKNSVYNLVENYQIQFDGGEVIQRHGLTNAYINFVLNSELSEEDERVYGKLINYRKDNSTSWQYVETAGSSGIGMCNNLNSDITTASDFGHKICNSAMLERQGTITNIARKGANLLFGTDETKYNIFNMNYVKNTSTHKEIHYTAIIPLRHLLFFEELPPLRAGKIKLSLQINQCYFEFTKSATALTLDHSKTQITGGNTLPLMLASLGSVDKISGGSDLAIEGGCNGLTDGDYRVSLSISQNRWTSHENGGGVAHKISNCRWYSHKYIMNPEVEKMVLERTGNVKQISYKDVNYHVVSDFAPGASKSFYIENSILNPIRLIIVPVLSDKEGQGNGANGSEFPVIQSPFTTEPATCSPHMFGDVQLRIGGRNVYQRALNYKYEQFLSELGKDTRISQVDYENTYGYIVFDLKNRIWDQESKAVSVHLSLKNYGLKNYDLHCFIEYEKTCSLNLYTGNLISTMST